MKRLWAAIALLSLILMGSLLNARSIVRITDSLTQQMEQAQELVQAGHWDQALLCSRQAHQLWEQNYFYLHVVIRHSELDQIACGFDRVQLALVQQDWNQYISAKTDLTAQLSFMRDMERPSLVNIL